METPLPSTPPPFCCSPKSKLICLSAGLLALLLVAILNFFLGRASVKPLSIAQISPTPLPTEAPAKIDDLTANWKTYTNPPTKYLLKHPQSWEVQEYPNADLPYVIHRLELLKNNKPQLVIETYREFLVKGVPEDKIIRSEQIIISGVPGTKNWHKSFGPPVEFIVSFDAKTYRILLRDVDASQTVDQILSTFKFLE